MKSILFLCILFSLCWIIACAATLIDHARDCKDMSNEFTILFILTFVTAGSWALYFS